MALIPGCHPRCTACPHRELTSQQSEAQKQGFVAAQLDAWKDRLVPLRGVPESLRWGYRERVCLHASFIKGSVGGVWQFGLLRSGGRGAEDEWVPIPDCPVHSARVRQQLQILSQELPGPELLPLAYVALTPQFVTLVVRAGVKTHAPLLSAFDWQGLARQLDCRGIHLNFHPSSGRRVFASRGWVTAWGESRAKDAEGFIEGPQGFQQLLGELHRESLDQAEQFLNPSPRDAVLDLYCGGGRSIRRWELRGAQCLGVELGSESVECAARNIDTRLSRVLKGRCSHRIPQLDQWIAQTHFENLVAYLNPPRTGLEQEVLHWLGQVARPRRLAYLSCSPGTLARDLQVLTAFGYQVSQIQPYDFFPQTRHVEVLAMLQILPSDPR